MGERKWVADKLETIRPLRRLIASGGGRGSRLGRLREFAIRGADSQATVLGGI